MKTHKAFFSFFTALALILATSALAQTPPNNDDFAHSTVLTGSSITFTGTLVGATVEPAETNSSFAWGWPLGRSVWWTWTAPESTAVVVAIQPEGWANTTNAVLSVFGGTDLNALSSLGYLEANEFTKPPCGYVRFLATAGTSYQIRVSAYTNSGSVGGPFTLKLTATNPPVFVVQPQDCTVSPYGSAFFSAIATGAQPYLSPLTVYQWYFNQVPIPGEIYPSLIVHGVTTNQVGTYSVTASNLGGVSQSAVVSLTLVDTNPVPRLSPLRPISSSLLPFSLTGEPGRWYKVESSTNLHDWINPIWLQLTNPTTLVSVPRLAPNHFIRASLNVPTDVCVAQLKQLWWGVHLFRINNSFPDSQPYGLYDARPYCPTNSDGFFLLCPEGGRHDAGGSVRNPPTCTLQSHGHVIADQ
jgi:hypothetical protein